MFSATDSADDLILDVMPTESKILGFSNVRYPVAMREATDFTLPNYKNIRVVTAPCFLATKIEAFDGRGNGDYLLSHDLEDLISVIDGRPEVNEEVQQCDETLRVFLANRFRVFLDDQRFIEALPGKVPGDASSQARVPIIVERLNNIAENDYIG